MRDSTKRSTKRSTQRSTQVGLALTAALVVVGFAFVDVGRAQGPGAAPVAPPDGTAAAPESASPNVKITIITVPQAKRTFVLWGKKKLGVIAPHQPLILQRPRDSGPMDLILQSEGYVSVQTRAYTFGDSKLSVKLTPIDQKKTLLGYREQVPSPDAGAPPPPPGAPPPAPGAPPPTAAAPPPAPFGAQPDAGAR